MKAIQIYYLLMKSSRHCEILPVLVEEIWDVSCPVYSNKRRGRLVPQQSEGLCDEGKPSWDIDKEKRGQDNVQ